MMEYRDGGAVLPNPTTIILTPIPFSLSEAAWFSSMELVEYLEHHWKINVVILVHGIGLHRFI